MTKTNDNALPLSDAASDVFFEAVDKAVQFAGPRLARHSFRKVSQHALRLLDDAMTAFRAGR